MTVAFWANPASLSGNYLFVKGTGSTVSWHITLNNSGRLTFLRNYSGSTDLNLRFNNQLVLNQWHHYVFVWNGNADTSSVRLYRDGVLQPDPFGDAGAGSKVADASNVLYVGGAPGMGTTNVRLDDVRMYNRMLTQTEITALYNYR